jgi:vitamin B12 transporter
MRFHRLFAVFLVSVTLVSVVAVTRTVEAAVLAGRALDPDDRGVSSARIVVTGPLGTVAEAVTGPTGDFTFDRLPDGEYDLVVSASGFRAAPERVTLSGDERREVTVRLRLAAISESVVVSASPIEVARSTAPASLTVVTGEDLATHQVEGVGDALRQVPGLSVARSGGRGALTSVFPRGGASNYTLVLVDGVRANSFGGAYDFAHLTTADIDRVEIIRGPQSALYGAEAIGAVVQVITRRGGAPRIDGLIEGGGYGTARATVGASGGGRGSWSWGLGAEHAQSDGETGTTASGERISNDDYTRSYAGGTLGFAKAGGLDFALTGAIAQDERGFPGPWGSDPVGAFPGIDRVSRGTNDTRRIGIRLAHPWTTSVRQRVEVGYFDLASDFVSPYGPSSSGTRRFDARLQEDLALGPHVGVSAGGELVDERGRSTYVMGNAGSPIPIDREVAGLFGEVRWLPQSRTNITAGARLEHIVRDDVEPDPAAFPPRPAFPRQVVTSVNPKVAVSYRLTRDAEARDTTRIRASAGTGIRPPDVFEIAFTDNSDLRPERSRSAEVGVEQLWAGGALVVDAAFFWNRYDDLIVTVGRALSDASRYRSDNISNARARGLELQGRTRLVRGLSVGAAYTWLSTEILSVDGLADAAPPPFAVGDPLIRRPRHQVSLDLTYAVGRVSAFATLGGRSQTLDLEPNYGAFGGLFYSPGYAVTDVGGALALWSSRLEIFGRVNNVTNRQYEETLGYPALGRAGLIGVRVAAGR